MKAACFSGLNGKMLQLDNRTLMSRAITKNKGFILISFSMNRIEIVKKHHVTLEYTMSDDKIGEL